MSSKNGVDHSMSCIIVITTVGVIDREIVICVSQRVGAEIAILIARVINRSKTLTRLSDIGRTRLNRTVGRVAG